MGQLRLLPTSTPAEHCPLVLTCLLFVLVETIALDFYQLVRSHEQRIADFLNTLLANTQLPLSILNQNLYDFYRAFLLQNLNSLMVG